MQLHDVALVVLNCFLDIFALRMHTNYYLPASDKNSDIARALRFSDPDFRLKKNNNLSIVRRFYAVTLTYDT